MKTLLLNTAILLLVASCFTLNAQKIDFVKNANLANEKKAEDEIVDEKVAEFLVKSADARMMDMMEGKLAAKKGSTLAIKEYGALMVKDQAMLLNQIKEMAVKLNITLPADISINKENGFDDLVEKDGRNFDEKFIKMMMLDHERDIALFKNATQFEDRDVRAFAQQYLPMIQSHLDKIEVIKESVK